MLKQQLQLQEDFEKRVFAVPLHYFGLGDASQKYVAIEPMQAVPHELGLINQPIQ